MSGRHLPITGSLVISANRVSPSELAFEWRFFKFDELSRTEPEDIIC